MRTYFALTAFALLLAALVGAALAWDGSAYLFQILDNQAPFTPNNRLINIPLHLPVLLASQYTSDVSILQTVFGLVYAIIPLAALALSWWIVRAQARSLFVWAALGIGLGTLPGQFFFVSESNIAVQLFWPIVLAILTHMRWRHVPLVILLAAGVFFAHPFATILFAFATALAFVVGLLHKPERFRMWSWALIFGLITAAITVRFLTLRSNYETDQLSWDVLSWTYDVSMAGVPIKALVLTCLAAVVIFAAPLVKKRWPRIPASALYSIELICFILTALLLVFWALNPQLWRWADRYTFWAPFISLFFTSITALESFIATPMSLQWAESSWQHRIRTLQVTACVFCLVLSAQSWAWLGLTQQLNQTMAESSWSCISTAPIAWLDRTALNHFATPHHAILIQGRTPQKVMLSGDECGQQTFATGVWLDRYGERGWKRGWFQLQPLGQRVIAEQEVPNGCSLMLTAGWHQTESNGRYWWRWSNGRDAQMRVLVERDMDATLKAAIQTYQQPNQVDVLLNGEQLTTLEVNWDGMRSFKPITLRLHNGANIIAFVSHNPPVEDGERLLAINIGGVSLTPTDADVTCRLHQ